MASPGSVKRSAQTEYEFVPLQHAGPATGLSSPAQDPFNSTVALDEAVYTDAASMQSNTAFPPPHFDPQQGRPYPTESGAPRPSGKDHRSSHHMSWDLLAGIRKFEHSYEQFDSRNASEAHLAFAEGDMPKNRFARLYHYLLNVSIVTRWTLFILPPLALFWIPGTLGLTVFPNAAIWAVKLIWWSIFLTSIWVGWWVTLAVARIAPPVARRTIGVVVVASRRYIDWFGVLHRYVAFFGWAVGSWIAWNPLIDTRQQPNASSKSASAISLIGKLWFALLLCAGILLAEKVAIQWIAGNFHETSYADRISEQKFAIRSLVTLYRHSNDIPGRSDTLRAGPAEKRASRPPHHLIKRALKGVRLAATTTTTAFGTVASEIAGSSVLQPNSPQSVVKTALQSANKTRMLARRLFYSFVQKDAKSMYVQDISKFFASPEEANAAYTLFDKDTNGDVTRDEIEMACMEIHREQLALEHSLQDLDSAVGRLDNIFMSLYFIIALLIIAVAVEAQFATIVTGAGTLILSLSWLVGGSCQEVLTSIIFLFVKHPYDVGDRIIIGTAGYTVKEIMLLSTVLVDLQGCSVQAPHTLLNAQFIQNIRRSGQMSETFEFDVAFSTTFEQLEALREKMLAFVTKESRDFLPAFDVTVVDFPDQKQLTLKADIKYKSNWQQGALKAQRRNKWICTLKTALAETKIFGLTGNPSAIPDPTRYTLVPWETVEAKDRKAMKDKAADSDSTTEVLNSDWNLTDKDAAILETTTDSIEENDKSQAATPYSRREIQ